MAAESPGRYIVVFSKKGHFLQAVQDGSPSREHLSFQRKHGYPPWVLEFGDPEPLEQGRALGFFTAEQVEAAFGAYVGGSDSWYQEHQWAPCSLERADNLELQLLAIEWLGTGEDREAVTKALILQGASAEEAQRLILGRREYGRARRFLF